MLILEIILIFVIEIRIQYRSFGIRLYETKTQKK